MGIDSQSPYEESFWNSVYAAREAFYREQFGELPSDIMKMLNLVGVWPGGGLFALLADTLGDGLWVYSTFGLTNPDMPTSTLSSDVEVERDDQGRVIRSSSRLSAKKPTAKREGLAGYGYEIIVVVKEKAEWPFGFLQWAANAELLNDIGLLDRVEKYGGLTVEDIGVGGNDAVNVLIAKAQIPLPAGTFLPNGYMTLLVATVITTDEMRWSMKNSRDALMRKLQEAEIGQVSIRGRKSVVMA